MATSCECLKSLLLLSYADILQSTGFADTVPVIREATVKAVYPLASKVRNITLHRPCLAKISTRSCRTVYLIMTCYDY